MISNNGSYPIHPAALIFPEMDAASFKKFKADLKQHGLRDPVVVCDGRLLDGRHRERACRELGIPVRTVQWQGDDPVAFVISTNLHRRHLTPGQLAMCAARAKEAFAAQAKERQKEAQERGRQKQKGIVANLPQSIPDAGTARDKAGKAFGISGKSVDHATKVLNNATPEIRLAVDEGRMGVSTAAILSTEPEDVQRKEATHPKRRRTYQSVSKPQAGETNGEQTEDDQGGEIKVRGVGVIRAHEAINCLMRIPKNDALRKRGFQVVTDWIRHNP